MTVSPDWTGDVVELLLSRQMAVAYTVWRTNMNNVSKWLPLVVSMGVVIGLVLVTMNVSKANRVATTALDAANGAASAIDGKTGVRPVLGIDEEGAMTKSGLLSIAFNSITAIRTTLGLGEKGELVDGGFLKSLKSDVNDLDVYIEGNNKDLQAEFNKLSYTGPDGKTVIKMDADGAAIIGLLIKHDKAIASLQGQVATERNKRVEAANQTVIDLIAKIKIADPAWYEANVAKVDVNKKLHDGKDDFENLVLAKGKALLQEPPPALESVASAPAATPPPPTAKESKLEQIVEIQGRAINNLASKRIPIIGRAAARAAAREDMKVVETLK